MMNILQKIVETKKEEISSSKFEESLQDLRARIEGMEAARPFAEHFRKEESSRTRIIAEIKKASPSGGLLCPDYDPVKIGEEYLNAGATALSILTDFPYFQGRLEDLNRVKARNPLPILRKDFLIDPYQIVQSRAYGADCILLIVAILEPSQLIDFAGLAAELRMGILIEVHDEQELQAALGVKEEKLLLGVNNRNLKTLKTDLQTTATLLPGVPQHRPVISESGIKTRQQIEHLQALGVSGFLIGESLLKSKNIRQGLETLLGK